MGLGELRGLIQAQSRDLADQRGLLADYRQDLVGNRRSLEQIGAEVKRLALEHQQLADEVQGLGEQFSDPQQPIRDPGSDVPATGDSGHLLPGAEWLSRQDPAHFTIQLVAAHAPEAIDEVAHGFPPAATLARYRRLHAGSDWHVLLYGSYPAFRQAQEAIAVLPNNLQSYGPWIRRFKSVQADLVQSSGRTGTSY